MKKLCAVGLAALCLAGSMSCFTMAEASENVQEQAQDQMLYSSRMWESNGHIYTVYNVDAEGYTSLSGNYMDAIAVYEGKAGSIWTQEKKSGGSAIQIQSGK